MQKFGWLNRELMGDPLLNAYSVLILDEVCTIVSLPISRFGNKFNKIKAYLAWLAHDRSQPLMNSPILILEALSSQVQSEE